MRIWESLVAGIIAMTISQTAIAAGPQMSVYKTPTCGCCQKWVDHMRADGFDVSVTEVASTAEYRRKFGVPEKLLSCHTAVVNGYAVEGHVPAAEVQRLLSTRPRAGGLAVPGNANWFSGDGARPDTTGFFRPALRRKGLRVPKVRGEVVQRADSVAPQLDEFPLKSSARTAAGLRDLLANRSGCFTIRHANGC